MKMHIIPGLEFEEDKHKVIENAGFAPLDALYKGRKAYYGDFHAHSDSGGTSDGKMKPENWLLAMREYKIDFIGLLDHK